VVRVRQVRDEIPLPDEAVLVRLVFNRHDPRRVFDTDVLLEDATRNYELFGFYGLSLWGVSEAWPMDKVLAVKARLSRYVALFRAGDLRERGLGIVPSGRSPHYDTHLGVVGGATSGAVQVTAGSAADLVLRFTSAHYTVAKNQHFTSGLG
jgi:hypothetical protein